MKNAVKNKKLDLLAGLVENFVDINEQLNMPELETEESAEQRRNQQGQGLKILTPQQMLSTSPISLAQLKAENMLDYYRDKKLYQKLLSRLKRECSRNNQI